MVRNDTAWFLYFSGDGKLVERVDKGASERIRELVVKRRELLRRWKRAV
jgi:hypothetical protein